MPLDKARSNGLCSRSSETASFGEDQLEIQLGAHRDVSQEPGWMKIQVQKTYGVHPISELVDKELTAS